MALGYEIYARHMIRPLADLVLIAPDKVENTTSSGLVLSTNEGSKQGYGVVVDPGTHDSLKAGDRVRFNAYMGEEVEEFVLIHPDYILCVIED